MGDMTKRQHFVALLIMLPSIPFALPLSLLVFVTKWAAIGAENLYDLVGTPFLAVRRIWIIRCEERNSKAQTPPHSGKE